MKRNEILGVIRMLACSQGMYGRLLRDIRENPEWGEEFLDECEAQNFGSSLDFVLWYEEG